ncbi:hypothetical protein EST38_g12549 [Candolleomyces aberdarensis]|uniref:NodB homology domain-containing protein n=1 Tax=Candolleomyces aberdarensis TaxID=2316362 RepID=A0A4Q2D566_9AGAR|nr:hypothetical protein EST38_g12549 [Candolleomyces aberdarensis]
MLTLKLILSLLAPIVCLVTVVSALPAHQLDKRAKAQVFRSCTVPNTVALTFDDGPYSYGNDLVNMLNAAGVKGTFFLKAIQRITGAIPAFVRPPFGDYNDLVLEAAGARGQTIANWDFDSEDGKSATVARQKGLYDAVVAAHPSSILSLQHEVHQTSVYEVLPYAIEKLKGAGYRFVTVAECLNIRPYQTLGAPAPRDVWGPKI